MKLKQPMKSATGGTLWPISPATRRSFPKIRVPYFGVLIVRILLFRVLY